MYSASFSDLGSYRSLPTAFSERLANYEMRVVLGGEVEERLEAVCVCFSGDLI